MNTQEDMNTKEDIRFFCPYIDCKDHDNHNEYGCGAVSGGSSAPYPLFCKRHEDIDEE